MSVWKTNSRWKVIIIVVIIIIVIIVVIVIVVDAITSQLLQQ